MEEQFRIEVKCEPVLEKMQQLNYLIYKNKIKQTNNDKNYRKLHMYITLQ